MSKLLSALLLLMLTMPVTASEAVISIIIDDMGDRLQLGQRAIHLPGVMTYAFLPHAPHSKKLAEQAHSQDKQVMLHQPMASLSGRKLGKGGLHENMDAKQLEQVLNENLSAVPHVEGINNHMGSLLTRQETVMQSFMKALVNRGKFFFIDSRTTSDSVALQQARELGIESSTRDIFLDHEKTPDFIHAQIDALIERAKRKGYALAIGHPYRETLEALEARLPLLKQQGIKMVKASDYIQGKEQTRLAWQTSLSHSPRVVKN